MSDRLLSREGVTAVFLDRRGWLPGPWDTEPDRVEWRYGGVPCVAHRGPHGNWCGYVGLPPGHPWWGLGMFDVPDAAHDAVNGGVTYARHGWSDPPRGVCHTSRDGEPHYPPDALWWVGFDCLHAYDLPPEPGWPVASGAVYRTLHDVKRWVEALADVAIAAATTGGGS